MVMKNRKVDAKARETGSRREERIGQLPSQVFSAALRLPASALNSFMEDSHGLGGFAGSREILVDTARPVS